MSYNKTLNYMKLFRLFYETLNRVKLIGIKVRVTNIFFLCIINLLVTIKYIMNQLKRFKCTFLFSLCIFFTGNLIL